jgi:ubiquinone/menaquinone biosynthesis C-methylase UbiE
MSEKQRWFNYRKANNDFPKVRKIELDLMLDYVNAKKGEIILECGTGNGYLTFPLAKKVGKKGKVYTYDVTKDNLKAVKEKNKIKKLNIITKNQSMDYKFDLPSNSIDKIVTIATFHHYDNIIEKTGISGKVKAMKEFARLLKPKGKVILGDVCNNTDAQKYFYSINNPIYCHPNGHPHEFIDKKIIETMCKKSGLKLLKVEYKQTPWVFNSEKQAQDFLHTIHNAKCSKEESLEHAKKYLKFVKNKKQVSLGWSLIYFIAQKTK